MNPQTRRPAELVILLQCSRLNLPALTIISLDFENGKAEVILLADWDTVKTNKFASRAIAYLLNCENEKLPKEIMVAFE